MAIVTLTSDFGESDHYIACMKGVILQHAPTAHLIDVTHHIAPHDIVHAAFVLRQVVEHFPTGTIHLAVVDPGVGTARHLLAARYEGQFILAPDNGLLSLVHRDFRLEELRVIQNERLYRPEIKRYLHGRDVLAPVAGHMARGLLFEHVGPPINQMEVLNLQRPKRLPDGGMEGQVLYVDRFGNLISNISCEELEPMQRSGHVPRIHVGPLQVGPLKHTYADVKAGEILAIIGSTGMLEVAINQGNAAAQLRASPGTIVVAR